MNTNEAIEYVDEMLGYLCRNYDIVYGYTLCLLDKEIVNEFQVKEICQVIACRAADGKYSF